MLELFVRNQGAVLSRSTITSRVWDENHDPFANALEALVRRLRAKIDDAFEPKLIQTVRGAGSGACVRCASSTLADAGSSRSRQRT